jgi:hypothetical protein
MYHPERKIFKKLPSCGLKAAGRGVAESPQPADSECLIHEIN